MSRSLVLKRDASPESLVATLKALELQKTLDSEPVLTALRHFPAQAARHVPFPDALHPKLCAALRGRGPAALADQLVAQVERRVAAPRRAVEGCQ